MPQPFRLDLIRLGQTRLDCSALYCTVVEVKVKAALLYSTKCNQTQRGGGVVVRWCVVVCGGVVFSYYNTTLV